MFLILDVTLHKLVFMNVHILAAAKKVALIRVSWVQWSMSITRKKLEIEFGRWSKKISYFIFARKSLLSEQPQPNLYIFCCRISVRHRYPQKLNFDLFIIQH
jgi:hypothetical protein